MKAKSSERLAMLRSTTQSFPSVAASPRMWSVRAVAVTCLSVLLSMTALADADADDPWQGYNRWMFEFNDGADRLIVKPIATGYDFIMPQFVRVGTNNFFSNFYDFNGVLNALLQGRVEEALNNTVRVITNSTIGLLGFFDVASQAGVPRYETDFGHTLSVWGVPQGNFVMLPFIGPSTVRAASGSAVDAFISPTGQMFNDDAYWGLRVFNLIDLRAGLLDAEQVISGDRYVFFRDVYLQRRAVLDAGGQVKDDFSEFDNDWDEDAF